MLIGRLTKDIELRYTQSNKACASFSVAINRPYKNGEEKQTDFINIVVWEHLAENLNKYTSKGSLLGIEGRLQTRTYEASDGKKRVITEVLASNIQFLDTKRENTTERIDNGLPEENVPW